MSRPTRPSGSVIAATTSSTPFTANWYLLALAPASNVSTPPDASAPAAIAPSGVAMPVRYTIDNATMAPNESNERTDSVWRW